MQHSRSIKILGWCFVSKNRKGPQANSCNGSGSSVFELKFNATSVRYWGMQFVNASCTLLQDGYEVANIDLMAQPGMTSECEFDLSQQVNGWDAKTMEILFLSLLTFLALIILWKLRTGSFAVSYSGWIQTRVKVPFRWEVLKCRASKQTGLASPKPPGSHRWTLLKNLVKQSWATWLLPVSCNLSHSAAAWIAFVSGLSLRNTDHADGRLVTDGGSATAFQCMTCLSAPALLLHSICFTFSNRFFFLDFLSLQTNIESHHVV